MLPTRGIHRATRSEAAKPLPSLVLGAECWGSTNLQALTRILGRVAHKRKMPSEIPSRRHDKIDAPLNL